MQTPLRVHFHGVDASPALEARIRDEVDALHRAHPGMTGCQVAVLAPHRHHHQGVLYAVHVDVTVPGRQISAGRQPELDHAHEDPYVAIRDAFRAARRQLERHADRRHHDVKTHQEPELGRVTELAPGERHGFLETEEGLRVYFHEHAVAEGRFDDLAVGDPVRFVVAEGEGRDGPQASTVVQVGHPGRAVPGKEGRRR